MSKNSLQGASAIVTGASAGIGLATAKRLAADGANIALAARSEDRLTDIAAEIQDKYGVDTFVSPTDIRDPDAVEELIQTTIDLFGGIEILVNNAGITPPGFEDRFEEVPASEYAEMIETNVYGAFYTTYSALPALRESQGNLVFVGSSAGKFPRAGSPVYAATKWWLRGFALSIEAEAGQDGVAVTLINPTAVRTGVWPDLDPGEAAEPEEVADVISVATRQEPHTTISEIDLFRRDLLGKFIPKEIDIERAYETDLSE